ncbi:MAG: hypothetical protein AAFU73_04175 [Planctomycetota bacterium]
MDLSLIDLWLPILAGAGFVFIASCVMHMALPWHKNDFGKLPNEDSVLAGLRDANLPRGCYRFPHATSMADFKEPAMLQKFEDGPVGLMTILPTGMPKMGGALFTWFLYSLLVAAVAGYVASMTLNGDSDGMLVLRVTSAIAVLAHATSNMMNSIWKGEPWSISAKFAVDGLIYGMLTGAAFMWFWPAG